MARVITFSLDKYINQIRAINFGGQFESPKEKRYAQLQDEYAKAKNLEDKERIGKELKKLGKELGIQAHFNDCCDDVDL